MKIFQAEESDLEEVKHIIDSSIYDVYPHYYPADVVVYFINHHKSDKILADIKKGCVFLLKTEEEKGYPAVGTITVINNEITRFFVKPEYQNKGYGTVLLDFIESKVEKEFNVIRLDASLPSYGLYSKRGYVPISFNTVTCSKGGVLFYQGMEKRLKAGKKEILGFVHDEIFSYDGRTFLIIDSPPNSEISKDTIFYYHQTSNIIWAEFSGGEIVKGFLTGVVFPDNSLSFTFSYVNKRGVPKNGRCKSVPQKLFDGRIRLTETWQMLTDVFVQGTSIIEEINLI